MAATQPQQQHKSQKKRLPDRDTSGTALLTPRARDVPAQSR